MEHEAKLCLHYDFNVIIFMTHFILTTNIGSVSNSIVEKQNLFCENSFSFILLRKYGVLHCEVFGTLHVVVRG